MAIFDLLAAHPDGLTCDEVERALNQAHQTVSARISGLVRDGFIRANGEVRLTRYGRKARVYVTTAAGRGARAILAMYG